MQQTASPIALLFRKRKYAKIIVQRKYFQKNEEYLKEHPEEAKRQRRILTEKYNEIIIPDTTAIKPKRRSLEDMPYIDFVKFGSIRNIDKIFPLVIFHVNTTGLNKSTDKIIEITANKYDINFKLIETFSTFVNPGKPISKEATSINHITDSMVSDSPPFYQISGQFKNFIDGYNICGYFLRFDLQFLYKAGIDFSDKVKYYDLREMALDKIPKEKVDNYQLETVCEYYNVSCFYNRCETIESLFEEMLKKHKKYDV